MIFADQGTAAQRPTASCYQDIPLVLLRELVGGVVMLLGFNQNILPQVGDITAIIKRHSQPFLCCKAVTQVIVFEPELETNISERLPGIHTEPKLSNRLQLVF